MTDEKAAHAARGSALDRALAALDEAGAIEQSNYAAVSPHLALAYRAAAGFMADELAELGGRDGEEAAT